MKDIKEQKKIPVFNLKGGIGTTTTIEGIAIAYSNDDTTDGDIGIVNIDNDPISVFTVRKEDKMHYRDLYHKMLDIKSQFSNVLNINTLQIKQHPNPSLPILESTNTLFFKEIIEKPAVLLIDAGSHYMTNQIFIDLLKSGVQEIMVPIDYDRKSINSTINTLKFIYAHIEDLKYNIPSEGKIEVFIYFAKYEGPNLSIDQAVLEITKAYPKVIVFKNHIKSSEYLHTANSGKLKKGNTHELEDANSKFYAEFKVIVLKLK